jgi:hypothetical protein
MPAGYVRMSSSGCLLPLLIILNLFFGRLFFTSTGWWLGFELLLILIFVIKIKLMFSSLSRYFDPGRRQTGERPSGKIIDVQGHEVKDGHELE